MADHASLLGKLEEIVTIMLEFQRVIWRYVTLCNCVRRNVTVCAVIVLGISCEV